MTLDASAFHVCRAIDTENFIGIRCLKIGSTQFREVYSRENSNLSLEFSESTTLTVGDTFRLECDGDTWTAFHNDTQFATGDIPAFLTGVGATLTGICARGGPLDPWADNYKSGTLVAEGASTGTLAATETGADTASITGSAPSSGTMDADESGSDTFSSVEPSTGSLAATEREPTPSPAPAPRRALAPWRPTETGADTFAASGTAPSSGSSGCDRSRRGRFHGERHRRLDRLTGRNRDWLGHLLGPGRRLHRRLDDRPGDRRGRLHSQRQRPELRLDGCHRGRLRHVLDAGVQDAAARRRRGKAAKKARQRIKTVWQRLEDARKKKNKYQELEARKARAELESIASKLGIAAPAAPEIETLDSVLADLVALSEQAALGAGLQQLKAVKVPEPLRVQDRGRSRRDQPAKVRGRPCG